MLQQNDHALQLKKIGIHVAVIILKITLFNRSKNDSSKNYKTKIIVCNEWDTHAPLCSMLWKRGCCSLYPLSMSILMSTTFE